MLIYLPLGSYILALLILSALVHSERYWWSAFDIVATMLLFHWFGFWTLGWGWGPWVASHPYEVVGGVVTYIPIGILWAFFRWSKLVRSAARTWKEAKAEFAKRWDISLTYIPGNLQNVQPGPCAQGTLTRSGSSLTSEWRQTSKPYEVEWDDEHHKPTIPAKNHKARIVGWMAYWPVSILGWVLGDMLVDLWNGVYSRVVGVFQRHADRQFE